MSAADDLSSVLAALVAELSERGWYCATAESCTGGAISAELTSLPGSSAWFERGFVTYSDAAKTELLGVSPGTLAAHGAVSEQVALEMVAGALARSRAQAALAVTGIAGPDGGSADKPVGTVVLAWQTAERAAVARRQWFAGDRAVVRAAAGRCAISGLLELLRVK